MARIKWFENEQIVVYIYGELYEKHHLRHVLILKKDEDCQYGFDSQPIHGTKRLKKNPIMIWFPRGLSKMQISWKKHGI